MMGAYCCWYGVGKRGSLVGRCPRTEWNADSPDSKTKSLSAAIIIITDYRNYHYYCEMFSSHHEFNSTKTIYHYRVLLVNWKVALAWIFENTPLLWGNLGIFLWFPLIISQSFVLGSYDHNSNIWFPISIWHRLSLFNHKLYLWWMLDKQNKSTGKIIRGN